VRRRPGSYRGWRISSRTIGHRRRRSWKERRKNRSTDPEGTEGDGGHGEAQGDDRITGGDFEVAEEPPDQRRRPPQVQGSDRRDRLHHVQDLAGRMTSGKDGLIIPLSYIIHMG